MTRNRIVRTAFSWILLLTLTPIAVSAPPTVIKTTPAADAFDRFRSLSGHWQGKSTKGWESVMKARVIAGESVLAMTSFDAHPDEEMLTTLVLDGDRLTLTHYCVARNQPRLIASSISEDGRRIVFEFQDGTNLPTRDRGHMDKVVYNFLTEDHFTSRWTWYQDGKEQWMEEIHYHRLPGESTTGAGSR